MKYIPSLCVFLLLVACSSTPQPAAPSLTPAAPAIATTQSSDSTGSAATPVSSPAALSTPSETPVSGVTTDVLNIRAGPGINYAILGQLQQGDTITVTAKSADGLWWQFNKGWVSATYVRTSGDGSALPVGTPDATPTQ